MRKLLTFVAMTTALYVSGVVGDLQLAKGQEPILIERLFRSVLTSVTPIYESGQEGNQDAIVGLRTESTVFEINEPIENGVIPRPRASDAEPLGRVVAELRFLADGRLDKSKPLQILVGKARFTGRALRFEAKGTSIVHWCRDEGGAYNGVRWTDFSGAITEIHGRHEGAKGHMVGTRLLVGDPEMTGQSGLIILRLRR
jgi:hypothetical protein